MEWYTVLVTPLKGSMRSHNRTFQKVLNLKSEILRFHLRLLFRWCELSLTFTPLQKWEGSAEHSLEKVGSQVLEKHNYDTALDKEKAQLKVKESLTLVTNCLTLCCLEGTAKMRPWAQMCGLTCNPRKQEGEIGESQKKKKKGGNQHDGSLSRSLVWATWAQFHQDSWEG